MPAVETPTSFAEAIKANRVFILGAGFSAAAGLPLTQQLLCDAFAMFSRECPGVYSRVEGHAMDLLGCEDGPLDIAALDFGELCTFLEYNELREFAGGERWSENVGREKLALRYYLAKTIVASTPPADRVPKLYREFALLLRPGDMVISFNWDGLLEAALQAVGKTFSYDRRGPSLITINKLHGSVNWRLGEPRRLDDEPPWLAWKKLKFAGGIVQRSLYWADDLLGQRTWDNFEPLDEVEPYLVLPGYGKSFDVRANAPLWYKPEYAFAFTHDVYIIGLSLAPDDFFVRSFFLANLPYIAKVTGIPGRRVIIINPSEDVKRDYEFVLKKEDLASVWQEKFCIDHVNQIAAASQASSRSTDNG